MHNCFPEVRIRLFGVSAIYRTKVIPTGNHASIAIPDEVLARLGTNRRAPLVVTINGHSYRSTATAVNAQCRVVFPIAERLAAGVSGGDTITVKLELDDGHREVELHPKFSDSLKKSKLRKKFDALSYSVRKEYARSIIEAKAEETRDRRIEKAINEVAKK